MTDRLQLESVRIRGYRSLEDVEVPLGALNVVIGPNGVGKTSLLDALALFSDALGRRDSLGQLLSRRGGIGRVLTLGRRDLLEIEFACRRLGEGKRVPGSFRYDLALASTGIGHFIGREHLSEEVDESRARTLIERHVQELKIHDSALNALVPWDQPSPGELMLAQIPRALAEAELVRAALADIHSCPAIPVGVDSPVRRPQTLEPTDMVVGPLAQNLFSVLHQIDQEEPDWYERILEVLRVAFPGFQKLNIRSVAAGQVILAWHHDSFPDQPFFANELSAGTLRFLHLVTLLLTPRSPTVLLIDEPEDSLHPDLLRLIAELLLEAAERTQIIVATQSPALLQWLKPEHVLVADQEDGACRVTPGTDLNLKDWLAEYSLDRLWQMGNLGGRP